MSVVVSVRIREEVKKVLEEDINISEEARRRLEELVTRVKLRKYLRK